MFAHVLDALVSLAPASSAVMIATLIYKLARHAIDDKDRWRRFMYIAAPVLVLVFAVTGFATYWLIWNHGAQLLLQVVGHTVVPATGHRT